MPSIVVHHRIDDLNHWLDSPKREEFFGPLGIKNIRTFTNPQNPNEVALTMDVPDVEALLSALQSPEATAAMEHDGVHADSVVLLVEA